MTPIHETLETGPLQVNCQIIGNPENGKAVVIDPGGSAQAILRVLASLELTLTHIIATHGHFDHVGGVADLQKASKAPFLLHEADRDQVRQASAHARTWGIPFGAPPSIDGGFVDGDLLELSGLSFKVIHTPGHTQGGVCFHFGDSLVVGDTLFAGSIGRTDLPGGNHRQLITSVKTRLFPLPDNTVCYPGHGPLTSIGDEKRYNAFLNSL